MMNWYVGWSLILSAFVSGAVIGLFFHKEEFMGGYSSFRRRLTRLGHIAQAALGMLNVLFAVSTPTVEGWPAQLASLGMIVGGLSMPTVCFLTAWKPGFRRLFFIPVASLMTGVIQTLLNGMP
jgi:hypothetical protein